MLSMNSWEIFITPFQCFFQVIDIFTDLPNDVSPKHPIYIKIREFQRSFDMNDIDTFKWYIHNPYALQSSIIFRINQLRISDIPEDNYMGKSFFIALAISDYSTTFKIESFSIIIEHDGSFSCMFSPNPRNNTCSTRILH